MSAMKKSMLIENADAKVMDITTVDVEEWMKGRGLWRSWPEGKDEVTTDVYFEAVADVCRKGEAGKFRKSLKNVKVPIG